MICVSDCPWDYRVSGLQFTEWDEEAHRWEIHTVTAEEARNGWFWIRYALGLVIQDGSLAPTGFVVLDSLRDIFTRQNRHGGSDSAWTSPAL